MKMKTIIKLLFVFSLPFIFCRCADDGIHYEREINVPEGIYLTGSASQFSVEAINGKMNVIKDYLCDSLLHHDLRLCRLSIFWHCIQLLISGKKIAA